MNNKGFSLVTVIVLSLFIFLIGGTGLYIAATNFRATRADINLNLAEKASNAGLMNAFDQINQTGSGGDNRTIPGTIGQASYVTQIELGGRNVWFLSSKGTSDHSKIVKTAMFQGYYGVGLYTVRGRVDANLGGARLSGCDATPDPDCFVPAFIASGTINTGSTTPQTCTNAAGNLVSGATDGSTAGVYGSPGILNLDQGDLSKIFFRVKCFNKNNDASCGISLLDYFEYDYGRNLSNSSVYDFSFQQTSNKLGIPVVSFSAPLSAPPVNLPSVSASCQVATGTTLNLADVGVANCTQIVLLKSLTISGSGVRSGSRVEIYSYGYSQTFDSTAKNFTLYSRSNFTVNGSSDFTIKSDTGAGIVNTGTSNFNLYTTGTTTLNGAIGTTTNPFRIVSTNTINAGANAVLTNGTLITGPTTNTEINSSTAPQNLVAVGDITIDNVNIFARRIGFADNSSVKIWNSLIYVYAYACPTCSREASTSSRDACDGNTDWCGYYGSGISLNLGRDPATDTAKPVLFISNNTAVKTNINSGTEYIWGVWYGEDVTYLRWDGSANVNIKGFLIRNFPPTLTLDINLSNRWRYNFSKPMIDTVSNKYRFFRQVECVRDPLTPKAQLIQTRMTNY